MNTIELICSTDWGYGNKKNTKQAINVSCEGNSTCSIQSHCMDHIELIGIRQYVVATLGSL